MPRLRIISLLTVAVMPLLATQAGAQMYPGEDVIVNPNAIPGRPYSGIALHPPTHHRRHHRAVAKAVPVETGTTTPDASTGGAATGGTADTTAPAPTRHKHKAEEAAAAPPAQTGGDSSGGALPFSFGGDELGSPAVPAKPAGKSQKQADAAPAGLAKRGAILFEHDSTDPQQSQVHGIQLLASDLNSAIEAGATSIQLVAFGGAPGDKSSDSRRIALKRAQSIRQILIDNGVPAARIDVQAKGGITDGGEPDRVDVYVKAN